MLTSDICRLMVKILLLRQKKKIVKEINLVKSNEKQTALYEVNLHELKKATFNCIRTVTTEQPKKALTNLKIYHEETNSSDMMKRMGML